MLELFLLPIMRAPLSLLWRRTKEDPSECPIRHDRSHYACEWRTERAWSESSTERAWSESRT